LPCICIYVIKSGLEYKNVNLIYEQFERSNQDSNKENQDKLHETLVFLVRWSICVPNVLGI
jgi:hypothetical protein